jgi:hypothetical protein
LLAVSVAWVDRFWIRRGRIELSELVGAGFVVRPTSKTDMKPQSFFRLQISFKAFPPLIFSRVHYTVRDKLNPATVISGKSRTLDFSLKGHNSEYLLIREDLLTDGEWIADVRVESLGCRINPLYKIFPMSSHMRSDIVISQGPHHAE